MALGIGGAAAPPGWNAIARAATAILLAFPIMFSGTVLIVIFAVGLGWLPATGQRGIASLILPAIAVGTSTAGGIARALDAGLTDALGQPFLRSARAKGLSHWRAIWRHGMRVGVLPVLDVIAVQIGYLLGGAIVTETVFARQGVGRLLLAAVLNQDMPVVQAVVLYSALAYTLLNLLADVVLAWLDPRVRAEL